MRLRIISIPYLYITIMTIKKLIKDWWRILLVILLLGLLYFRVSGQNEVIPNLSGGLLVEVLGSVLTFLLIERVLQKSEEMKRRRMEKAALTSFRFTIVDLLNLFWNMRRAAARAALDSPPANWREAISSDPAIDDIKHLDFLSDAGIHPPLTWNNYVAQSFQNVHLPAIRRLIESYAPFLSERLVEKLEALNGAELFCRMFLQAGGLSSIPERPQQIPMLACVEGSIRSAIAGLLDLVDIYNELCPEKRIEFPGMDLKEKTKPLVGTGRVEYMEEWK